MAIAIAVLSPHQASFTALAMLCSGPGKQHSNMFGLTGDAPEAASLFVHAASLLGGNDPRDFVHGESREALHRNRAGQCTVPALAAAVALRDAMPGRMIVAGYSVGEVAAWGVGDLLSPTDTLDLVTGRTVDAATQLTTG
jgi:[acyl-carrier-protein] S-malonyltransferase